jgi:hypothetical protein
MITLLQQVPIDRALLVVFLAGQLYAQFKSVKRSQRSQGERVGALETRVTALEALGKRG